MSSDLSDLEQRRLENIRRNTQFLLDLGFNTGSSKLLDAKNEEEEIVKRAAAVKKKALSERRQRGSKRERGDEIDGNSREGSSNSNSNGSSERRFSRRIRAKTDEDETDANNYSSKSSSSASYVTAIGKGDVDDDDDDAAEKPIDYNDMPTDSNELDDSEFEIYVFLKAWRLKTCRELDIEPYKICQNRTLCELIRRKRNNTNWAKKSKEKKEKEEVNSEIEVDLLECWGIGPSKAKKDGGYGYTIVQLLDEDDKMAGFLESSRANNSYAEDMTIANMENKEKEEEL